MMHEEKHLKPRNLYFQVINQAWKQIPLNEHIVQKLLSQQPLPRCLPDELKQAKGENREEERKENRSKWETPTRMVMEETLGESTLSPEQ